GADRGVRRGRDFPRHAAPEEICQGERRSADVGSRAIMIAAILFDKDGTLYDFYRTLGALTEQAALFVAVGGAERARFLMENSGKDPVTGKFAPSSPIAAGSN